MNNQFTDMRICVITGIFPPDSGGPATYVPRISREFVHLGHKVTIITCSDELSHDDSTYPFKVMRIRRGLFKPFRFLVAIVQIIKAGWQSDILFVNGLGLEASLANIVLRKPVICKIVGDVAWERARNKGLTNDNIDEFQRKRYSFGVELSKIFRSLSVKAADLIITPGQYMGNIITGWGIDKAKIRVIYNALESIQRVPQQSRAVIRKELNLSGNVILTVARLISLKCIDQLIEVVSEIENVNLVIVGDGPEENKLRTLSSSMGVEDRVKFVGRIKHEEVYKYMKAADIFVLNSIHETFPHVILEAMLCETPVIATSVGGIPEIVKHNLNGILIERNNKVELKQAIERLLTDEPLKKRLIANAKNTLEKFSWDNLVVQTISTMETLVKM